ncbi:Uncharacterized protein conserved in bacteria [Moraxella lacunata]|uniref:Uncharacterized protein conserved in bacteria n=1 Tax=Moraxella lacunata TaxID=477 RepID=A0A378TRR1_MORLA|nr:type VI secretion system membrane subunit TssM [Moraxella lacunata]STZ63341.1 Uncharacterized protein conserved in bacteria [Moraxella lacunata]
MNFLSMINVGMLWGGFGAVSLISMIWFGGAYLQIGTWKPLEPTWVKVLLSCLIILVVIGVNVYKWYKQRQLNKHVMEELKASDLSSDDKAVNKNKITEQFNSVDLILQKHNDTQNKNLVQRLFTDKKGYIYQKPWFLLVGASGVGKTTSILNSGLKFPIGTVDNTSRLAGTQDCDWFLTDDAVLIDTAGRFVEQDSQSKNSDDWQELLHLLKRCRTKQPINGLVLMIGADDIMKNDEQYLESQLSEFRIRLQEVQNTFNISFPFYVVINKIDLITGFGQYFNYLTEEDRNKVFGITLDVLSDNSAEKINIITKKLDDIAESIELNIFNSVAYNNQQNEPSDLALSFASEFADFTTHLKSYLKKLLNLSKYDAMLHLGGVYFTSSAQQEMGEMTHANLKYQLQSKYIQDNNGLMFGSKPYFINHFYHFVLMEASNLAGTDASWLKKQRMIYWGLCLLLSVLTIACAVIFVKAFFKNSAYLDKVEKNTQEAHAVSSSVDGSNALAVLDFANKVRVIPNRDISAELTQKSFLGDVGLNDYDRIYATSQQKYRSLIEGSLNELISTTIKEKLKNNTTQGSLAGLYQNLKAYLMLYNHKHYDGKFIAGWVQSNLPNEAFESNADNFEQLKQILIDKKITPKDPQDLAMINKAREMLAGQDIGNVVYADLIGYTQTLDTKGMPSVSFVSMGGSATQSLFRRISGKTLNSPMPVLYTKYGYQNLFLPYVNTRLDNFYNTENWVMPSNDFFASKDQVLSDIYQKYTNDYITYWQQYIADIRMLEPKNLQQTIVMSKQLSEKNSSLAGIIRGIYDNTNLVEEVAKPTPDVANDATANTGQEAKQGKEAVMQAKKTAKTNETSAQMRGYLQDVATHFSQFHVLAQSSEGMPSQLDEIAKSINDLYVYLVALQMSMQNNDALMPDNKPVINYQAQVSRLPDPFRPMLDQFVGQISQTSKDYQQTYKDEQAQAVIEEQKKTVLSIAEQQDAHVRQGCESLITGKYPFDKSASQEVSLQEFAKVFGSEGLFMQTLQSNILVNERLSTPFLSLLEGSDRHKHYQNAQKINTKFLAGSKNPALDFTMKIMAMDKDIKELSVSYDGTQTTYYHGPQKSIKLSWPSTQKSMTLKAMDFNNQSHGLEVKGDWSVFRLMDKASRIINTKDNKGVIATFELDKHEVHIEFKSISGTNPFLLGELKGFVC